MSFSKLGLSEELVRAVTEHGYTQPTPIQTQAIPAVLAGGDLMAGAQTGTGKTAGFVLPILQRLSMPVAPAAAANPGEAKAFRKPIRALILTPTRELAAQVEESVRVYGKHSKLTSTVVFGGVSIHAQIARLKRGVDILVATPGRLLDLAQQNAVTLRHVDILVLDEADRMLDMGFIPDVRRILGLLPAKRQNLLFSATFSDEIKLLADRMLNNPAMIEVERRNSTVEMISQKVHPVDRDRKRELLSHLIKSQSWRQVLVFTRTKHGANKLTDMLVRDGITALAIHGNKSQPARTRALDEFKEGSLQVLVATDIASRGIDIDQLPHVVNFDLPNVPEDYIHRIGRTGRAGATGEAVSLVCVDEKQFLSDIERLIKRQIPQEVVKGFEPDPSIRAEPIKQRSQGHQGQRGQHNGGARGNAGNGHGAGRGRSDRGHARQPANGNNARSGNKQPATGTSPMAAVLTHALNAKSAGSSPPRARPVSGNTFATKQRVAHRSGGRGR